MSDFSKKEKKENVVESEGLGALDHILSEDKKDATKESFNNKNFTKKQIIISVVLVVVAILAYQFAPVKQDTKSQDINKIAIKFNSNDLNGAESIAKSILEKDPNNISALLALASTLAQRGSIEFKEKEYGDRAIKNAEKVLKIDSQNAEAYRIIGYANEIQENYNIAIKNYDKAISIDPEFALAYSQKGHVYDLSGDIGAAEWNYIKALTISPKLDHALLNMARVHFRRGEVLESNKALDALLSSTNNNRFKADAFQLKGLMTLSVGDFTKAESLFKKALSIDGNLTQALTGLAESRYYSLPSKTSAEFENAIKNILEPLGKAIEINSNSAVARIIMARTLKLVGNTEVAHKILNDALKSVDNDITLTALEKTEVRKTINKELKNK